MFTSGLYLLLMILGFGLLIFVHELGHFVAAKWAGIRTEAFAVGMGPVVFAWRKGVGFAAGSTHRRVVEHTGKAPADLSDEELVRHGLGETEYSLRWLPIGGFVRMLGQEDANPETTSDDPRSYNKCPIGKRMIVVSAGVIMNILLAAVLFVAVFMIGVKFDAPVVGHVDPTAPAAVTFPDDAVALGIESPGLQSGDLVTHIDGKEAKTFADVQIAGAMSRPDVPVRLTVQRPGIDDPLNFTLRPEHDTMQGLRSIGVMPAFSTELPGRDRDGSVRQFLQRSGLADQGVQLGMRMISANGRELSTFQQFQAVVDQSGGEPIRTIWADASGAEVEATIDVRPQFAILRYPGMVSGESADVIQNYEEGLLGLTPPVALAVPTESPNHGTLRDDDVVFNLASLEAPRMREFREFIQQHPAGPLAMRVLRDGEYVELTATVSRRGTFDSAGMLNVLPQWAWDVPYTAAPMDQIAVMDDGELVVRDTPFAAHQLFGGTRIERVNATPISNWTDLREALREHTAEAHAAQRGEQISMTIVHPTPGRDVETIQVDLDAEQIAMLHELNWRTDLSQFMFEPTQVVRSAGGNPLTALAMGAEETWKMTQLTYLTIDRLFRRTVGVDQLRGPVGIVHIGVTIADRGLLYLIFLLAVISVNLAVINFLPLPIVDGGLFLFLIYEKIKGQPPSVAFQNWATIFGLLLIGTLFLVVTYNDLMRLFS